MSMDYFIGCKDCGLCIPVLWVNAGGTMGTPLAKPESVEQFQSFMNDHYRHGLAFLTESDAAEMDTPEERKEAP